MYHIKINISTIHFLFWIILFMFFKSQSVFSQITKDTNLPVYQKYLFENSDFAITLESNEQFIYENDSCNITFIIKNKTNKDIYILGGSSVFLFSSCENKLRDAIISFGGSFDGGIDYDVNLIKIKPNFSFSNQTNLFSDKFKKFSNLYEINVKFSFGYLESDKIDSLGSCYPEYTSIKTEKINENELKTSAYALYMYWKTIDVGSLLIRYQYKN